jgi:hypothetical protein
MSAFQFCQILNVTVFLFVLFLILYGKLSTLWRLGLPIFLIALIVAILAIRTGGLSQWYWLPATWAIGFPFLLIAGFVTREKKLPLHKNIWDGRTHWPFG